MNKRVVEHKIKLEKSVKIILGVLAFGVFLNAFAPVFDVREASAAKTYITFDHRDLQVFKDMRDALSDIGRSIRNHK